MKKIASIALLVLIASSALLVHQTKVVPYATPAQPVHNINTGLNYTTIQAAIDDPETLDGQTIDCDAGNYTENVWVYKSLSIIGAGPSLAMIWPAEPNDTSFVTASSVTIEGFTIMSVSGYSGVLLSQTSSCTISNDVFTGSGGGITLRGSNDTLISGNSIYSVPGNGIFVADSSQRNEITNNNLNRNHYGIFVTNASNYNVISDNFVNSSDWSGIRLNWQGAGFAPVMFNNITGNFLTNNGGEGILLDYPSNNNYVNDNNVSGNNEGMHLRQANSNTVACNVVISNNLGVSCESSSGNLIHDNVIAFGGVGVSVTDSSDNSFYLNDFLSNSQQVSSTDSSVNLWNTTYPVGGNYWNDYTGVDNKSGPNQDQPGSDGIGDTPYVINPSNKDYLPRMLPSAMPWTPIVEDEVQDWTVSSDGSGNASLSWRIPASPLADQWRASFFGDNIPPVQAGKAYDVPENMTVEPTISVAQNVTDMSLPGDILGEGKVSGDDLIVMAWSFGSMAGQPRWNPNADINNDGKISGDDLIVAAKNFGKMRPTPEIVEPVRDPIFSDIVQEEATWPGFETNITAGTVIPFEPDNGTEWNVEASSPQVAENMSSFWRIPFEPNDTGYQGYVMMKLQFIQDMLEAMSNESNLVYSPFLYDSSLTVHLPAGALIINAPELTGLNWTINFGGTTLHASVSTGSSTVTINELWTVTTQNFTATEDYLNTTFAGYKVFNIDFTDPSVPSSDQTVTSEKAYNVQNDYSHDFKWTLGSLTWAYTWANGGSSIVLKCTYSWTLTWHIEWTFQWWWPPLTEFETHVTVTPTVVASASATMTNTYWSASYSKNLGSWNIPFSFFGVSANFICAISADLGVTASGQISAWASVSLSEPTTIGVEWTDDGWSYEYSQTPTCSLTGPTITGKTSLSVTPDVLIHTAVLFYGLVGPYADVKPLLPITITVNSPNTWEIDLNVSLGAGITFAGWLKSLFGLHDYNPGSATYHIAKWTGNW
jgi:parallel beta-helix repeat protein